MAQPHTHDDHSHAASRAEAVRQLCKSKGVRWTVQRQAIFMALENTHGHVSAEDIFAQITRQFPEVNVSTVYRNLDMLCDMDILVKVHDPTDAVERFELRGDTLHHHLVCKNCGMITGVDDALIQSFTADIQSHYGFALELNHILGYGWCATCRAES